MDLFQLWPFAFVIAIFIAVVVLARKVSNAMRLRMTRAIEEQRGKMEAMFRATFPELQPHFHPARVHEFVAARRARKGAAGAFTWNRPPGFPAAAAAEVEPDGAREKVRIVDAAGATLAAFVFESLPEGGALRVGKGKLTATLNGPEPRVRYWHPEREFKWTPRTWKFQTRVADREIESSDSGTSFSHDSSSSSSSSTSSSIATGAAAAAGIAAAGGTFDGGGASAAWDGASGGRGESSATSY
jgi:uncharacterized membrane protein YgcG